MFEEYREAKARIQRIRNEIESITPEQFREREYKRLVAVMNERNARPGKLNVDHIDGFGRLVRGDGIDCQRCLNRGAVMVVRYDGTSLPTLEYQPCKCITRRGYARRLSDSGLAKAARKYRFDNFEASEPWQTYMLDKARKYVREGAAEGKWLYIGGQSGAGKSHLCTAVANELLKRDALRYVVWPQTARYIKGLVTDSERYDAEVSALQRVPYLFVDDFFKPTFGANGMEAVTTAADVRLAYDVLNYRYLAEMPTILSSEWFSAELAQIDEATAGRIAEACGEFKIDVARNPQRNHRLKNEVI